MVPYKIKSNENVAAIVVTYNRKYLLLKCINALLNQKYSCHIFIVDNASNDGTLEYLIKNKIDKFFGNKIFYLRLDKNTGGAGGFHDGLRYALGKHYNWYWLMDDDAVPDSKALKELMEFTGNENTILGSTVVNIRNNVMKLCWPAAPIHKNIIIEEYDKLEEVTEIESIPFLGFLVHQNLIRKIGLPEKSFFIYGDDVEYCLRARCSDSQILLIRESILIHPEVDQKIYNFICAKISYRKYSYWKTYYEIRNKILIGKKYFGTKLWTTTLPGIFIRFAIALLTENAPFQVVDTYLTAFIHGMKGKSGICILPK